MSSVTLRYRRGLQRMPLTSSSISQGRDEVRQTGAAVVGLLVLLGAPMWPGSIEWSAAHAEPAHVVERADQDPDHDSVSDPASRDDGSSEADAKETPRSTPTTSADPDEQHVICTTANPCDQWGRPAWELSVNQESTQRLLERFPQYQNPANVGEIELRAHRRAIELEGLPETTTTGWLEKGRLLGGPTIVSLGLRGNGNMIEREWSVIVLRLPLWDSRWYVGLTGGQAYGYQSDDATGSEWTSTWIGVATESEPSSPETAIGAMKLWSLDAGFKPVDTFRGPASLELRLNGSVAAISEVSYATVVDADQHTFVQDTLRQQFQFLSPVTAQLQMDLGLRLWRSSKEYGLYLKSRLATGVDIWRDGGAAFFWEAGLMLDLDPFVVRSTRSQVRHRRAYLGRLAERTYALARADREAISQDRTPLVEILEPVQGARVSPPSFDLHLRVRSPEAAPVESVQVSLDGVPIRKLSPEDVRGLGVAPVGPASSQSDFGAGWHLVTVEVTVPPPNAGASSPEASSPGSCEDHEVAVAAANKVTTVSVAHSLRVCSMQVERPSLYVLAVGVTNYDWRSLELKYGAKDAEDFSTVIRRQEGMLYERVEVQRLVDHEVTRDAVVEGLAWLEKQTGARDVAMVFIAGHGISEGDTYFFLPSSYDPERTRLTAVPLFAELETTRKRIAGTLVCFIDTCKATPGSAGTPRAPIDVTPWIRDLTAEQRAFVMVASRNESYENERWKNGAFTEALLEGLSGAAAGPDGRKITALGLCTFVSDRVSKLTDGMQHPICGVEWTPDFPLAVKPASALHR